MKKVKDKYNIIKFDTSVPYIIPMMPEENAFDDFSEVPVTTFITQNDKGSVYVKKEGFKSKYFEDRSFEFLLYTKYIKKVI